MGVDAIWHYPEITEEERLIFSELRSLPKLSLIPNLSLEVLIKKGYRDPQTILDLFNKDLNDLHNTFLLQDSVKAIQLLKDAIQNRKLIVVYGDYDADGTMGCVISVRALRMLGARVVHFTNDRFTEGYGINPKGLKRLYERHPNVELIFTVDNGISAFEGVSYAKEKGTTVIVSDHHEPPADGSLPEADAVVNPKRIGSEYPFRELCGAGLAYKLMLALAFEMNYPMQPFYELVSFAGLATVADVVPLKDENRILVKESLKEIKLEKLPIFRFLREAANIKNLTEETYGFKYGPMINACGRMTGSVEKVIEMFVADQPEYVRGLAKLKIWQEQQQGLPARPFEVVYQEVYQSQIKWQQDMAMYLVRENEYRKQVTLEQERIALELAEQQKDEKIIIIKHEHFHEGIVGLIAGHLKEHYYRPIFVLIDEDKEETQEDGSVIKVRTIKGSARSIDGFHLKEVLDACSEFLAGYGGHAPAAGLTVREGCFEALEQALRVEADKRLTSELLTPKIYVDKVITESDLTFEFMDELNPLRPFGVGFEKPILAIREFNVQQVLYRGKEQQHLNLMGHQVPVVMFNHGHQYKEDGEPQFLEVLGYPDVNIWNGNVSIQFMAQTIRSKQDTLFNPTS